MNDSDQVQWNQFVCEGGVKHRCWSHLRCGEEQMCQAVAPAHSTVQALHSLSDYLLWLKATLLSQLFFLLLPYIERCTDHVVFKLGPHDRRSTPAPAVSCWCKSILGGLYACGRSILLPLMEIKWVEVQHR